jgi:hypothetical protein
MTEKPLWQPSDILTADHDNDLDAESPKRRGRIPQSAWPRILAMHAEGSTLAQIARAFECTPSAISYILRKAEAMPSQLKADDGVDNAAIAPAPARVAPKEEPARLHPSALDTGLRPPREASIAPPVREARVELSEAPAPDERAVGAFEATGGRSGSLPHEQTGRDRHGGEQQGGWGGRQRRFHRPTDTLDGEPQANPPLQASSGQGMQGQAAYGAPRRPVPGQGPARAGFERPPSGSPAPSVQGRTHGTERPYGLERDERRRDERPMRQQHANGSSAGGPVPSAQGRPGRDRPFEGRGGETRFDSRPDPRNERAAWAGDESDRQPFDSSIDDQPSDVVYPYRLQRNPARLEAQETPQQPADQRMDEAARACAEAYRAWKSQSADGKGAQSLSDAVHDLRKVIARMEIELSASRREEVRPLPVSAYRANRSSPQQSRG